MATYTGLESNTDHELITEARVSDSKLAQELAKRLLKCKADLHNANAEIDDLESELSER